MLYKRSGVPRFYFDKRGHPRGYSMSAREAWFWHGSVVGAFIQFAFFIIALPLYYFPRAVWRTRLPAIAKVAIIGGVWGGAILATQIRDAHEASVARANGCIAIGSAPNGYFDPSTTNNCPDGYELGPQALTCAEIGSDPPKYVKPTGYDPRLGPICPAGADTAPKPGPGYTPPRYPVTPSLAAERAACRGRLGPETGPDFPPPVLDGSHYIVSCMDGTSVDVP